MSEILLPINGKDLAIAGTNGEYKLYFYFGDSWHFIPTAAIDLNREYLITMSQSAHQTITAEYNGAYYTTSFMAKVNNDVKPGKYHIVEILAGGTGREGGMISKTFTDPEIFKDQYLTVINDNYKETQPTTKETNSSSPTKNTTSNTSEITSKEIENTTKKTTDSSTSSISFEFIFVIVGFLVVAGLLFFLKALTDE